MQSVCQNKHVMKQEEAVRADLPLSLQMEYPDFAPPSPALLYSPVTTVAS